MEERIPELEKTIRAIQPDVDFNTVELDTPPHKFDVAIKRLRDAINDKEIFQELHTLSTRLMEIEYKNTTEQDEGYYRAERNRIIHALNRMALRYTRQFLNDLSRPNNPAIVPFGCLVVG